MPDIASHLKAADIVASVLFGLQIALPVGGFEKRRNL